MKLNEKLYILRKDENLSQEKLAKILDVSQGMIQKWEYGIHEPKASNIVKICKYFNISADELLDI